LNPGTASNWQAGTHIELIRESPTSFLDKDLKTADDLKPRNLSVPERFENSGVLMPMLVFDNIFVDRTVLEGERLMVRAGGQGSVESDNLRFSAASEVEGFYYARLPRQLNLALHGFAGTQGRDSLRSLYFLGGFDSVRGLPDGIHYGTTTLFSNGELRWLFFESSKLHIQAAGFLDHGTAYSKSTEIYGHRETSIGGGFRISVPQIYRLLVRIDYGYSVGTTKSQGLSIGLGQFFHPYKLSY
jgi:hypothetical protein